MFAYIQMKRILNYYEKVRQRKNLPPFIQPYFKIFTYNIS